VSRTTDLEEHSRLRKELMLLCRLQTESHQSDLFISRCLLSELVTTRCSPDSGAVPLLVDTQSADIPSTPLCALVMECGLINLSQYIKKNDTKLGSIQRIQILREALDALDFLHDRHIVHGDFKPENLVCFYSPRDGMQRWKLIDFEHSFDKNTSSPSKDYTPQYAAPEMVRSQVTSDAEKIDIWSLGMVSVFVMKGRDFWIQLDRSREFTLSMIFGIDDDIITRFLEREFNEKEYSFVDHCLKMDPKARLSCRKLKDKSLFTSHNSTLHVTSVQKYEELKKLLIDLTNQSNELLTEEMKSQIGDLWFQIASRR
jgi:serine/threonine protein kinase